MAYGKFGNQAVGRTDDRASAYALAKQKAKERADLAKEAAEKLKDPEYRKKFEEQQRKIQNNPNFKAKVPKGSEVSKGAKGGGGAAAGSKKSSMTDEERGAAYKAHWESTWKKTADQARARVAAERAAAANKPAAPKSSAIRRRGKGAGGGQFV